MDLQLELERSIGDGPALQVPSAHLARGQRALRRRRVTAATGALSFLLVAGAGYAALADGGRARDDTGVANGEDAPIDEFLDEVPYGLVNRCDGDPIVDCLPMPVDFTDDGGLRRLPGTRVIALARDPALRGNVTRSAGLEVIYEGERLWVSLQWEPGGSSDQREPAGNAGLTFEQWLALPGTFGGVYDGAPPRVETLHWWNARTGAFQIPAGVTVIRRVADPVGAPAEDSAGVVFDLEGKRYWTLTTRLLAGDDATDDDIRMAGVTVGAVSAERPGADFDAWLRDQAAERRADLRSR